MCEPMRVSPIRATPAPKGGVKTSDGSWALCNRWDSELGLPWCGVRTREIQEPSMPHLCWPRWTGLMLFVFCFLKRCYCFWILLSYQKKLNLIFMMAVHCRLSLGRNSTESLGIWVCLQPSCVGKSLYLLPRCGWVGAQKRGDGSHTRGHLNISGNLFSSLFFFVFSVLYILFISPFINLNLLWIATFCAWAEHWGVSEMLVPWSLWWFLDPRTTWNNAQQTSLPAYASLRDME